MKRLGLILACLFFTSLALAAKLPYDETADAKADITRGLALADAGKTNLLVVFGANWCPDCRRLDKKLYEKDSPLGKENFVVVKVDVGNFDKNLELVNAYGNPVKKGIPAAVVLTPDNQIVYKGRLVYLIEPQRRLFRTAVFAAAGLGLAVAAAGGIWLLRRKISAKGFARRADGGPPVQM
jgi:protein disulfide-isomerase